MKKKDGMIGDLPHIILETANVHGGDPTILRSLNKHFSQLDYPHLGIKFHPFKPDNVALEDFSWYDKIKEWFISDKVWRDIIAFSKKKKYSVWLDLFCEYGVQVLKQNLSEVDGIKLQASVLDNREVFDALKQLRLSHLKLILNIAGLELEIIHRWLKRYQNLDCLEVILQVGFQSFPTSIEDTSLKKISLLKDEFPGIPLGYADHLEGGTSFSKRFPVYAYLSGCDYIEKHICLDRNRTSIDRESAMELSEMKEMVDEIQQVARYYSAPFLSNSEKKYFQKTQQKVVVSNRLNKGQLVSRSDVVFRRTDRPGMGMDHIEELQHRYYVLNRGKNPLDLLEEPDFKKVRIGVIVACRMKSSRLKKKAIQPIRGIPAIERCLGNCLNISVADEVILATSQLDEDSILASHTLGGKVKFWIGDPDDVISRYLGACEKYQLDVIIRVTGDSPVISSEIADSLVKSHFMNGADFTQPNKFALGTNCEVYNVETLKRIHQKVGRAGYSEHMTLYVTNNPDLFKINTVILPQDLIRNYRLTLDYPEDLKMFEKLFEKMAERKLDGTLPHIFNVLDENPGIAKINSHLTQIYHTDKSLMELLKKETTIRR